MGVVGVTQVGEYKVINNDIKIIPDEIASSGGGAYRATVCNLGGGRALFACNVNSANTFIFIRALYFDHSGVITLGNWTTIAADTFGTGFEFAYFATAPIFRIDTHHAFLFRYIEHDYDGVNQQHDGITRRTVVRFTVNLDNNGNVSAYNGSPVPFNWDHCDAFAGDSTGTGEVWSAVWLSRRATPTVWYQRFDLAGGNGYGFADNDKEYYNSTGAANVAKDAFHYFAEQDPGAAPNNQHWRTFHSHVPGQNPTRIPFSFWGHARGDNLDKTLLVKNGVQYYMRVVTDDSVNYANPQVAVSTHLDDYGTYGETKINPLPSNLLGGDQAYDQRGSHLPGGGFLFKFDNANSGMTFVELDAEGNMTAQAQVGMHTYADTSWLTEIDNMGGLLSWDAATHERVAVISRGALDRIPDLRLLARDDVGPKITDSRSQQASSRVRTGGNTYV